MTTTVSTALSRAPYLGAARAEAPSIEPGPLALYLAAFPSRSVEWDWKRQLFAIYDTDPDTGARHREEFLCNTLEADDESPTGLWEVDMFTGERRLVWIGEHKTHGNNSRVFRPMDYAFVHYRRRDHFRMLELGRERFYEELDRENERAIDVEARGFAREVAAADAEARRWRRVPNGGKKIPLLPGVSIGATGQIIRT